MDRGISRTSGENSASQTSSLSRTENKLTPQEVARQSLRENAYRLNFYHHSIPEPEKKRLKPLAFGNYGTFVSDSVKVSGNPPKRTIHIFLAGVDPSTPEGDAFIELIQVQLGGVYAVNMELCCSVTSTPLGTRLSFDTFHYSDIFRAGWDYSKDETGIENEIRGYVETVRKNIAHFSKRNYSPEEIRSFAGMAVVDFTDRDPVARDPMVGKRPFCKDGNRVFNIPHGSPLADRVRDIAENVMKTIFDRCEVNQISEGNGIVYRISYPGVGFFAADRIEDNLFYFLVREISLLQIKGWSQDDIALDPDSLAEIEKNVRTRLSRVFGPMLDIEQRLGGNPT